MKTHMSFIVMWMVCVLGVAGERAFAQTAVDASNVYVVYVDQSAIPEAIKGFDEEKVKKDPICDSSKRPEIVSVNPDEVRPGDTITVTGRYFGRKKECLFKIVIGSEDGQNLTYIDEGTLKVTVPQSARPGLRFLNIQTGGGSARSAILIVTDK